MNKAMNARDWVGHSLASRELATPAYYFNLQAIIDDIARVRALLGGNVLQEVAACPLQEMLSRLPEPERFGAITSSRGELNMVAGWDTDHAYVHLPGLTSQLTRAVLGVGHRLIVESPAQIEGLVKVRGQRKVMPLMLSVHPSLVMPGAGGHLGMLRETLMQAVARAMEHGLVIDGLALAHKGAFDSDRAIAALDGMRALATDVERQTGRAAHRLIMGEWTDILHTAQDTAPYRAVVEAGPHDEILTHVGGLSIFERAGVLVTRVVDVQPGADGPRATCDAVVRGDFRANPALDGPRNLSRDTLGQHLTTLTGTTARDGATLGTTLGEVQVGDEIAFDGLGAYFRGFDPVVALEGKQLPALLFFDEEAADA
ncbi:hypothetical protein J4E08_08890 [Sagittula sp. NFXS13]|uniref:hypothetical protein n=1 Tax=Sagittula sp. NFXS13 TaxID=2819095 RepID=UPI0032DEFF95